MGPIQFRWIEAFCAVARTGSTTDAAEILKIDQSAVSRHIKALEGQLGLMLFERRQRGLRLTSEGSELLGTADGAIDALRRFQSHASQLGKLSGGHLHILTSATLARGLFPDVVRRFRDAHCNVTIEVEVVARTELERKVEMQQFDIGAIAMPFAYPTEFTLDLGSFPGVCLIPRGHRLAQQAAVKVVHLRDVPMVGLPVGTVGRVRIDDLFRADKLVYQPVVETTAVALGEHVAAGVGIAIMDPFSARAAVGEATVTRPLASTLSYEFGLLYPKDRPQTGLAHAFIAAVRSYVQDISRED
ncbi:MAG: LysR family transcriptional regulator [Hyphomicrobiaceae bacterium]